MIFLNIMCKAAAFPNPPTLTTTEMRRAENDDSNARATSSNTKATPSNTSAPSFFPLYSFSFFVPLPSLLFPRSLSSFSVFPLSSGVNPRKGKKEERERGRGKENEGRGTKKEKE
jgi:hypothetical protein